MGPGKGEQGCDHPHTMCSDQGYGIGVFGMSNLQVCAKLAFASAEGIFAPDKKRRHGPHIASQPSPLRSRGIF